MPSRAKKVKTETGAATPAASTPGGGSSTIFIKNMPWSATEDTVRSFFEEAGEVTDIRIGALPFDKFTDQTHCMLVCIIRCV